MRFSNSGSIDSARAVEIVEEFIALMGRLGIPIDPSSPMGHACWVVTDGPNRGLQEGPSDRTLDARPLLREECGCVTLVSKVVAASRLGSLDPVLKHLRLLTRAQPSTCEPLPSKRPSQLTENPYNAPDADVDWTRKVFELLVGLAAMRVGSKVELEDPTKSPTASGCDVRFLMDGRTVGLECKVPSGSMESVRDRITEGIEQIAKSDVDFGYVIVNSTSLLDHEKFVPATLAGPGKNVTYRSPPTADVHLDLLEQEHMDLALKLQSMIRGTTGASKFGGQGFILYGQVLGFVPTSEGAVPTTTAGCHYVRLTHVAQKMPNQVEEVARALTDQTVPVARGLVLTLEH